MTDQKIIRPRDIKQWYPFPVGKESPFKDEKITSQPSGKSLPSLEKKAK